MCWRLLPISSRRQTKVNFVLQKRSVADGEFDTVHEHQQDSMLVCSPIVAYGGVLPSAYPRGAYLAGGLLDFIFFYVCRFEELSVVDVLGCVSIISGYQYITNW